MALLVIPAHKKGNPRVDKNTAINSVKCGQSYNKENEALGGQEPITAPFLPQHRSDKAIQQCKLGRCYTLSTAIEDYSIFYIGCDSRTLSNMIIGYQSCQVH